MELLSLVLILSTVVVKRWRTPVVDLFFAKPSFPKKIIIFPLPGKVEAWIKNRFLKTSFYPQCFGIQPATNKKELAYLVKLI